MNKRADARRDAHGVTGRSDARKGKRFGAKAYFFMNNLDRRVRESTYGGTKAPAGVVVSMGNNIL
ncbi:MAG TPA: hypothetical protein VN879_00855 [Candidatus Acidoferrales bacterium]|nr:hypothetical protein [Candidatus Acidoferrales bacterium]